VLSALQPLLLALALTARQHRTRERLLTLCLGYIQTLGRHTMTGVLRSLGRDGLDWSAASRLFSQARCDLEVARRVLLAAVLDTLGANDPLVVVLDGTQLPRTSPRFPAIPLKRCALEEREQMSASATVVAQSSLQREVFDW